MSGTAAASQLLAGGPRWPRRRKTASERRQQAMRSEARRLLWACKALALVQTHRGGGLGSFGTAFLHALRGQTSSAHPPTEEPGDPNVSANPDVVSPSSEMCAVFTDGWHTIGAPATEVEHLNLPTIHFAPNVQAPGEDDGTLGGGHPHPRDTDAHSNPDAVMHSAVLASGPTPCEIAAGKLLTTTPSEVVTYKAGPRAGATKGIGKFLGAAGSLPFPRFQGGAGSGRGASQEAYEDAFPTIQTWYDPDTWQPTPE